MCGESNWHNVVAKIRQQRPSWRSSICIGIIIIGIFALGCIAIADPQKRFYTVIIDAGSTGSRVHVFGFHRSILNGSLILDDELYIQIAPGLSSFADDPVEGAKSLQVLLNKAKAFVPKSQWQSTPLSLKATAGLRLLPKEKANRLLEECEKLFENSGFLISEASVSIMDGTDEGIFSWFTVNFLLDRLTSQSHDNTVAALDMGGGSIQVTFAPDSNYSREQDEHMSTINVFNNNISIYTHSYLGMGLIAARKEILTHVQDVDKKQRNDSSASIIELRSECINPTISTKWSYHGVDYLVKGPINGSGSIVNAQNFTGVEEARPVVRFAECLQIVKNYVRTVANKPLRLENREIVAISYYFDRAKKVGLIDPFAGGIIAVDAFLKAAIESCDYPNTEQPFMCLDLTFIYVLLRDGFDLKPTTKLHVYDRINNHRLSWALGAAFNVMQNGL